MKPCRITQRLVKEAEDHESAFRVRIVAAVVVKGKIVSIGRNQNKTHPVAARYSKHKEAIFLHAEVDAINKAARLLKNFDKAELHVLRIKANGDFGGSKPCSGCQKCINHFGIRKVLHSV